MEAIGIGQTFVQFWSVDGTSATGTVMNPNVCSIDKDRPTHLAEVLSNIVTFRYGCWRSIVSAQVLRK